MLHLLSLLLLFRLFLLADSFVLAAFALAPFPAADPCVEAFAISFETVGLLAVASFF